MNKYLLFSFFVGIQAIITPSTIEISNEREMQVIELEREQSIVYPQAIENPKGNTVLAMITGYNTVPEQTDSTPCVASAGYVCGRRDTVACPTYLEHHTWVVIRGEKYECMDRTHPKYDGRFDINCDKDMECPYLVNGTATVTILD